MNKKDGQFYGGILALFLGITGFIVMIPKSGYEIINRGALSFLIIYGCILLILRFKPSNQPPTKNE